MALKWSCWAKTRDTPGKRRKEERKEAGNGRPQSPASSPPGVGEGTPGWLSNEENITGSEGEFDSVFSEAFGHSGLQDLLQVQAPLPRRPALTPTLTSEQLDKWPVYFSLEVINMASVCRSLG